MDAEKVRIFLESLSEEQTELGNRKDQEEHDRQFAAFEKAYAKGNCYLCGEDFDKMRADYPCTHWLLRRTNFKKKDFQKIYGRYDYHNRLYAVSSGI
jgi:hypothetical protein